VIVCRCLAAVDDPANGALKEGMYRVVEQVERNKGILVLILHLLRRFLEAGEHGALTTRQMLAGVSVLADFSKYLLNDDELIRDKREGCGKLRAIREALDVQHRVVEGIEVFQYGVFFVVDHLKKLIRFFGFCQHTLFDNLIHRGRGQAEAGVKASLNLGEVIAGNVNDGINRFLTCDHDPDLTTAASADLFNERLKVDHQVTISTDILTHFVHHEQQAEIFPLAIHIFCNVRNKLGNTQFVCFFAVKPVPGSLLAHAEDALHDLNNVILKESEGVPCFRPR